MAVKQGHLTQKGKTWYLVIRIDDPETNNAPLKWIKLESQTEDEAIKERRKIVVSIDEGKFRQPSRQTVGEWLFYWLENVCGPKVKAGKLAPNTYKSYEETVRLHLDKGLGHIKLDRLTAGDIDKYYNRKLLELSPTSVNYHARVLHSALKTAWVHDKIEVNPCDKVKPPSIRKYEAELPNKDFIGEVLDDLYDTVYYLPMVIAMTTGLRRGEVLGLTWDDIHLDEYYLTVRKALKQRKDGSVYFGPTKSKGIGEVPLTEACKAELEKALKDREMWMEIYGKENFNEWNTVCCCDNGQPVKPSALTRKWKRMKDRLGLDSNVRFHDLRHNYGTLVIADGADVTTAAANLRHAQISTTARYYVKTQRETQRESVKGLDKRLFEFSNTDESATNTEVD